MELVGMQLGGNVAYSATNPFADVSSIDASVVRGSQTAGVNPADRVQSISLGDGSADLEFEAAVDTGYSYGPFYTNRLLYLDVEAELMVVQFRDALDREVRLQFPPELTLKAYRNTGSQAQGDQSRGEAEAQLPVAVISKPANDGLSEALSIGPASADAAPDTVTTSGSGAPGTDQGAAPTAAQGQGGAPSSPPAPGQIVELVA